MSYLQIRPARGWKNDLLTWLPTSPICKAFLNWELHWMMAQRKTLPLTSVPPRDSYQTTPSSKMFKQRYIELNVKPSHLHHVYYQLSHFIMNMMITLETADAESVLLWWRSEKTEWRCRKYIRRLGNHEVNL